MPYRYAWAFLAALIAATIPAFWRSYFTIAQTLPTGIHIHGMTASLWMLLLLAQSVTPHRGALAFHRKLGVATFVAVPLFGGGAMAVIHSMAFATAHGDPFYALWGTQLGAIDLLAFSAVLYGVGMALRHRRNVRLHAGYMLSTALPMISPILGRLVARTVPGLIVHGPKDFPLFGWSAQIGNALAALVALWLWRRNPRHGRPWAVAFGVAVSQMLVFELVAASGAARSAFASVGEWPLPVMIAVGVAAGAAATIAGWKAAAGRPRIGAPAAAV